MIWLLLFAVVVVAALYVLFCCLCLLGLSLIAVPVVDVLWYLVLFCCVCGLICCFRCFVYSL